jgi:hypothetical protein
MEYDCGVKVHYKSHVDDLLLDVCIVWMWEVLPMALTMEATLPTTAQCKCKSIISNINNEQLRKPKMSNRNPI